MSKLVKFIGIFTTVFVIATGVYTFDKEVSANSHQDFSKAYDVDIVRDWITMSDGVRLSVTYYIPQPSVVGEKFPIVFEMLPYRKDDSFAARDYPVYYYLAQAGIAGARVDIRGMGASEGKVPDREYSDIELQDMEECINYVAELAWGNGNVGLQGKSWSAINGIMMAMRDLDPVKATLFMHGSEDIYANDLHTIDGGLHFDIFAIEMETENMMPAYPDYRLDAAYFDNRFNVTPWMFNYLEHQTDGPFWLEGRSLFTDYPSFQVPAYLIGGLLDGYRDFVPKIATNVDSDVFVRQEMGPWNHSWPNTGAPNPNYEWRITAVRWWQEWLNGVDTGITDDPVNYVFMRDYVAPNQYLEVTPGNFRIADRVVIPDEELVFNLQGDFTLTPATSESVMEAMTHTLAYQADSGVEVGNWWGEPTGDMRGADEGGLVYDSAPMSEDKILLGFPEATLVVAADQVMADWIVRLEDVAPDGRVSLVTGGLINGAQRVSRIDPTAIVPGAFFEVNIPMRYTDWTFEPGHKIRLVVTNAQFPMIWPTPYSMNTQLTIGDGSSFLTLPIVEADGFIPPMPEPIVDGPFNPNVEEIYSIPLTPFTATHDPLTGITTATAREAVSWKITDPDTLSETVYEVKEDVTYTVDIGDPSRSGFVGTGSYLINQGSRQVLGKVTLTVSSTTTNFIVNVRREIYENGTLMGSRSWSDTIARDFQ